MSLSQMHTMVGGVWVPVSVLNPLPTSGGGGGGGSTFAGSGTQAATGSGTALNGGTSLACSEVYVQNDPASTNTLTVGSGAAQPIALTPGSGMSLQLANVNLVFIKVTGTAQANWLARA